MFADYDPKVLPQLLEFSHRYICDVLEDADRYREHRAKAGGGGDVKMNKEDFRLAVQATVDFTSQWENIKNLKVQADLKTASEDRVYANTRPIVVCCIP